MNTFTSKKKVDLIKDKMFETMINNQNYHKKIKNPSLIF